MLATRAGVAGDAKALTRAAIDTGHDVTTLLAPVIGAGGVEVLFSRAIQQAAKNLPWLAATPNDGARDAPLATLQVRLAGQQSAAVEEASATIFLNFVELLATLIGESLTDRLLGPVWVRATGRVNGRANDE